MEATLRGWINELEESLAATESDREKMETTLRGRINEFKERFAASENEKEQMETTLRGRINELEETLAASESDREQMETTLRGFITDREENWKKKLGRWSNWCTSSLSIYRKWRGGAKKLKPPCVTTFINWAVSMKKERVTFKKLDRPFVAKPDSWRKGFRT